VCGSAALTKLKYFGINQSCAEFGNTAWPGQLGKDYTWPSPSSSMPYPPFPMSQTNKASQLTTSSVRA